MRLRKQKKAVAVTLATAIAVSTISASASAVSYDLANGDVTIDQNQDRGAFSYQGEDKETNRTYVNEDKADDGKIIIKQADKDTATDNTVTVKEDVKKTEGGKDVDIVVDGVNVDTSKSTDTSDASKDARTAVTVGEGADVNLTVKDSTLTTGGNGIDLGKNLDGKDENKDTKVDLTLEDSTIKLTEKDNTAGIDARDNSEVDISLKGNNTIDGKKALEDAAKEAEEAGGKKTPNRNVEGIRVGGESAGDSGDGKGSTVTIKGDETGDGGNLNIDHTSTGMVITNKSDVTLTDSADVDIKHTEAGSSTQGGRGVVARGDLTVEDKSSLTIDTVGKGAYKIDDDKGGLVYGNNGYGIDGTADITVKDGSKLEIKGTQNSAIYGGKDASLTVENDSTLDIDSNGRGIDYEGTAGDILFRDSEVDIDSKGMGISVAPGGSTNITFDHSNGTITTEKGTAIYGPEYDANYHGTGKGKLTFTNESDVTLDASTGIFAGFDEVEISDKSNVTSKGSVGMVFVGGQSGATKLHVTGESEYDLQMKGKAHAMRLNALPGAHSILVDDNSTLRIAQATEGASAICMGNDTTVTVDNGTLVTEGNFVKGIYSLGSNSATYIRNGSHVDVSSIVRGAKDQGQKLVVTGGTLTYDYSKANTLWPENAQGNKLTNFLLTKDADHADFGAFAYNGTKYEYVSDLNKEEGKQYLSVWVPAAALEYMLDVDGSHDPEIIGKTLADLQAAGYNFNTKYKTPDGVIVLRDMVVNGHSLNFTKTTDADGNTKLIWGNYEKQADGAPNPYDMVYGTEYEYEGKTYTIVWGYEHKNNANGSSADGLDQNILDAFDADSNVKVTGENITGENADDYTVTIYGALREVVEPTPDPDPTPDPTPDPDQPDTPVTPEDPTNPPVQDATPDEAETPANPENPTNPPVQDAAPDAPASTVSTLPKTGVNWIAALAMGLSGLTLMAAGAFTSLFRKSKH